MARHNPFYRHRSGPHRHRGVSLIELMIGIAIGMLIVVAAIGTMLYTRASSTTIGDSARLHQDAATAFRIIGETVRQTGARRLVGTGGTVEFNPAFVGLSTTAVITVSGTDGATTPTIAADTLNISYDSDSVVDVTDCLGNIAGSTSTGVTNTFEVASSNLRCDGNAASGSTVQPLIQNVEDFQVWYGIRDATESLRYVSASGIPDWSLARVETVMVCLRLSGETRSNPTAASVGCSGEAVAADGRIRRVFTRVFNLRNAGV
jgi:type IV pilus assembly protein PilW